MKNSITEDHGEPGLYHEYLQVVRTLMETEWQVYSLVQWDPEMGLSIAPKNNMKTGWWGEEIS